MAREDALRATLYHRLHVLVPMVSHRVFRGVWRTLVWSFLLIYFSFVALVLALRYSILPHIEDYRADIERLSSQRLGQNVSIGRIEASWDGINPDLSLLDVRVADADGRPALAFSRIEAILSWWSVPSAQLQLRLLRIEEPTLNLRRDIQGRFFIAGIPMRQEQNDSGVSDWILAQRRIRIHGATLVWEDDQRNAPALVLEDLNFALDNDGKRHRFGLTALPPERLASRIDVRGDFRGTDIEQMALWSGQAYAEINYADLAVWRQWIDYPVALPHGRGALRTWFGFAEGGLRDITADVSLQDVNLRLAPNLPELELDHMSGRLSAKFTGNGFDANGRRIELATRAITTQKNESRETIRIEPTDFHVDWRPEADGIGIGNVTASRLDLGALARLAEHVPFDAQSRQLLHEFSPRGQVSALSAKWKGNTEQLQTYTLKAVFDDLALKAQGYFPGFSGLSGVFEANDKGGSVTLRSQKSTLDLPSVFPVSLIELDSLNAQARWKINKGELDAEVSRVEFAGPEAAGSAQGTYRHTGDGPGFIDLTASLSRGDARAVWRYMPHVVNADARYWLRDSLLAGNSNEAKLILKGNLKDFPFLDKSKGQFLVTVKARDVVLDYGKGWPRIEGIYGNLRFEGKGMVVDAQRGTILGAKLVNTRAEIPDFDAPVSILHVKGKADGPTAEFLKFIERSPVGGQIDHFTEDMRATGNGHLDLNLVIPLEEARLGDSKIDGTYRFASNEVTVDSALPPIRQVNGTLQFSGSDLRIPEITGTLLGGPLKIRGGSQKDGRVLITADGSISAADLRKQIDLPIMESLAGAMTYHGEVHVNKRNADLVIDSNLAGLSSGLPEPFGKTAADLMSMHFEKRLLPVSLARNGDPLVRDQLSLSLGSTVTMQLIRRKQESGFATERGVVAIGRPAVLPERGISIGVTAKRVDADYWRRLFRTAAGGKKTGGATAPSSAPFDSLSLKTANLQVFGRHFDDVDLDASSAPSQWKVRLNSRQASGDLLWEGAGSGKLTARLRQISLDPSATSPGTVIEDPTEELPALDIVADDFSLGSRRFGRLDLQAVNEGGIWRLSRIQTTSPEGNLSGNGQWQLAGGRNRTQLTFKVDSNDVGRLLDRLGYPGTVRAGTAQMEGKVGWNGAPTDLDYESLSGDMTLEAGKGQFLKLDPGATGKLLGLISLQGLPRRMTLDFRDVFSEGFTFDTIASKVTIKNGLMRTDRLQIDGPSARVIMRGEVDLKHETQRLSLKVQPELGGTAALGVGLVNPIAGVATWVAHKILQNPLNQMFGFDYLVTGTWDDPKVEKLSNTTPPASAPRLPTVPNSSGAANESSAK